MFRVTNNLIFRPSSGSRRVRRPGSGGFSPVSAPRRSLSRSLDGHGDPDIGNLIIWVRSRIPEKYLTCRRGDGFGPGGKPGGVDRQPMYVKKIIFSLLDSFGTLRDVLPNQNCSFSLESISGNGVCVHWASTLQRLSITLLRGFTDPYNQTHSESSWR